MFVDFSKDIRYFAGIIYKVFRWGFIKSTDHRPTDHRPTDHPPLTHRPTDQLTTDPPTHRPNNNRPNRQGSISKI